MTTQATTPVVAPHDPARVPEIVAALHKVVHLQGLTPAEFDWLAKTALKSSPNRERFFSAKANRRIR